MRRVRETIVLLAALCGAAPAAGAEPANCGRKGVEVVYTRMADLASACDGLADVISLFRRMGFEFEPRLTVKFADARRKPAEGVVSYGHADVRSSLVVVYSSTHRQPWGQPWSPRLADSFLRHELAHIAVWRTPHSAAQRLAREWHEFIAYAVQFELMDSDLRDAALANFPHVRPFPDLAAVNEFTYAMDPDVLLWPHTSPTAKGVRRIFCAGCCAAT